jgi:CheY-like chemotaxis protein
VLRWIREQPALRGLPVITLHSMDDPREFQTARARGANACVVKPNNPADLCQLVRKLKDDWLA